MTASLLCARAQMPSQSRHSLGSMSGVLLPWSVASSTCCSQTYPRTVPPSLSCQSLGMTLSHENTNWQRLSAMLPLSGQSRHIYLCNVSCSELQAQAFMDLDPSSWILITLGQGSPEASLSSIGSHALSLSLKRISDCACGHCCIRKGGGGVCVCVCLYRFSQA